MLQIGLDVPISGVAHNLDEARDVAKKIGKFPLIIRPAFTLGGTGGGIGYNQEEFEAIAKGGIELSPVNEILIEESLLGWKEYEMEVMPATRPTTASSSVASSMTPLGVHTGDSITVAFIQTLTDKRFPDHARPEFRRHSRRGRRDRRLEHRFGGDVSGGMATLVIIEMNPRVSHSSAPHQQGHRLSLASPPNSPSATCSTNSRTTSRAKPPRASSRALITCVVTSSPLPSRNFRKPTPRSPHRLKASAKQR